VGAAVEKKNIVLPPVDTNLPQMNLARGCFPRLQTDEFRGIFKEFFPFRTTLSPARTFFSDAGWFHELHSFFEAPSAPRQSPVAQASTALSDGFLDPLVGFCAYRYTVAG